jgi:tRNA(adenine34) deaminase
MKDIYFLESFMQQALAEAKKAEALGEIPVGAIIVFEDQIISRACNTNRSEQNPILHAEIKAIELACAHFKNERLTGCSLFVTKEPCAMCAGAIIHSRIEKVFIGARDDKYGACGTVFNILGNKEFNHVPEIFFGILEGESVELIKSFFARLREKKKGT